MGARVTVLLNDTVVQQRVQWLSGAGVVALGEGPDDAFPTPDDGPIARLRAADGDAITVMPLDGRSLSVRLGDGERWRWRGEEGVEVEVAAVPRRHAPRFGGEVAGDLSLLVLVLALTVGVAQATLLMEMFFPAAVAAAVTVEEPTPELLARLLREDLDGEESGVIEQTERPSFKRGLKGVFMPAGQEDGSLSRHGGGASIGDVVERRDVPEPEKDPAPIKRELVTPSLEISDAASVREDAGMDAEVMSSAAEEAELVEQALDLDPRRPIERFVVWGFRDWFDVADARPETEARWRRHLDIARTRLAINPDDPAALNVVGYYAYLAENIELARETYERFSELHPDDPAGFNNLALTYKRTKQYAEEEALYRRALELDPADPNVLNNLAVNLSHQGRHEEALAIMELLEELSPVDPYADLHRAKIYAAIGRRERALRYLRKALDGVRELDTMHHIEFRQDIRIDPAFVQLRRDRRFARLLRRHYGDEAEGLVER